MEDLPVVHEEIALSAMRFTSAEVPTQDKDVRQMLRSLGEPITLFGEGPWERRERLRLKIESQEEEKPGEEEDEEEFQEDELFYTEGSKELLDLRRELAAFSLRAAAKRLQREKDIRTRIPPWEEREAVDKFNKHLQKSMAVQVSQVGDDRPLTQGRFSPDARHFATCGWSGSLKIWSVPKCGLVKTLRGPGDRLHGLAWRPNSQWTQEGAGEGEGGVIGMDVDAGGDGVEGGLCLAAACADKKIHLWKSGSVKPFGALEGHEDRVNRVEFSPSGRLLASSSHDGTWRLWDLERKTEVLLQEGHARGAYALKFHPDSSLVISGDLGGVVRVWDLRTGRCVLPLEGHVKQVLSVDVNPRGCHTIATASDDHTVKIWDLRQRRLSQNILAHNKLISDVVYEPLRGRFLLSASYDCSVKLWDSDKYATTKVLTGHEARIMGADVSPDGSMAASVSFDRTWKLWKCDDLFEGPDSELYLEPSEVLNLPPPVSAPVQETSAAAAGGAGEGSRVKREEEDEPMN
uniref:Pre-mRNA processing factor 4 (PRP4)-like domain-containing protein n=1 Tax=Chromera velia CCMP2878 TaxID=1169474 RepID=A0A0G4HG61_9ALVE|mmetsp:Transcript_16221/g.32858  ORF Transcript_16221/g.32858 Transcript_16221/m.32858 type:complete len:518 (-) Transcript_16221:423-1976(-)|eukprot:Cvel_6746.t1-p1 / transcript=Cvel_6746.t1 / gene=Cvel_6746 / organism=Chromera_velia_CCMP2878 / gene_product=U4/U6 small nuclear ribonucleoprotein Prp4, putative / transcript_product=U4/U6 small nuclear ribonucleoprotein Prp4, putative / location=Cvel_scaffold337:85173-90668(+) / protein_length=517 / sequence_SO=supercontig / SO=protein_coding / is_pseudo=false